MATPSSNVGISPTSTPDLPDPNSPPSEPTPSSTIWPLSSTLSPNIGTAIDVIAFLTAFSILIILTLYLRRHFGRKRLGFDVERSSGLGAGAYARFGRRFEGGDQDEAGNYKLRNSPRRSKGIKGLREGRGRMWEDWMGRHMERGREREREIDRERRRERERHLERGRQLWKGRVSEIGTMPPGS